MYDDRVDIMGRRVLEYRLDLHMPREDLAKEANILPRLLARIEAREAFAYNRLAAARIAEALGRNLEEVARELPKPVPRNLRPR